MSFAELRQKVIDLLCCIKDHGHVADIAPALEGLGLSINTARKVVCSENPRPGTMDFHRSFDAKFMLCQAEVFVERHGVNAAVQTPPQTTRSLRATRPTLANDGFW